MVERLADAVMIVPMEMVMFGYVVTGFSQEFRYIVIWVEIAGVEPEVKHGRFSYFVFKGLEGEADANQNGKISAGELHAYVKESVGRFSAGAQTPTMLGDAGRWVLR